MIRLGIRYLIQVTQHLLFHSQIRNGALKHGRAYSQKVQTKTVHAFGYCWIGLSELDII